MAKVGRKKKFSRKELGEIINQFASSKFNHGKMTYKKIVSFATEELHVKGLRYYHLSGNSEIKDLVNQYNESLNKLLCYTEKHNDKYIFSNINAEDFVDANYGNREKLIIAVTNYQQNYQKCINELIVKINRLKNIELELVVKTEQHNSIIIENKVLKKDLMDQKNINRMIVEKVNLLCNDEMSNYLSSLLDLQVTRVDTLSGRQEDELSMEKIVSRYPGVFD